MNSMTTRPVYSCTTLNCFLALLLLVFSVQSTAQSFVDLNAGITAISGGSGSWGDYDNDSDLDLLITGKDQAGNLLTKIYQNDNGSFTDINSGIPGVSNGMACWIDFDNDGDLDILITGENENENTLLYTNTEGIFSESLHNIGYFGAYSSAAWGDYDNDGDPDLFITGDWNSVLYENAGEGVFIQTEDEFTGLSSGRGSWADMDHDGDLDLLVSGDSGGGMKLFLYTNENEGFTETELPAMGLSAGSIEPGDYDADGDLDLLVMGFNDFVEPEANIFRNDEELGFTNIYAGLPPVTLGRASWGDYDNDGDLDVAITGKLSGCGVYVSELYENAGNDYFNSENLNLPGAELSFVSWGDFDNDTDLDLFLCGQPYSGGLFSKIYENVSTTPNSIPAPPPATAVDFSGNSVILSWEEGSDSETPAAGLTYNVRLGTAPAGCDILSPMAQLSSGFRMIPAMGNAGLENTWSLQGLEEGYTYYWSVQTIDAAYGASAFSEEQSFVVTFTGTDETASESRFTLFPNPAGNSLQIDWHESLSTPIEFEILSMSGQCLLHFRARPYESIDITSLPAGFYFLKSKDNKAGLIKLVIR